MPVLASSNRVQVRYVPEVTFGVTPATAPTEIRMTGESFNYDLSKESDKEIRSDGQQVSTTTVDASAAGDLKIHMQYAEYDRFFASVLRSSWTAFGVNGVGSVTFTADYTATTITASIATSGANIWTSLAKGQWFLLTAPTTPNDGLWLRVSASVAPTTTVITLDASTPCSVASATASCKISTSRLTNGTTLSSFTVEKEMADVAQFLAYRGQYASKFSTSLSAGQLTEGTFSFIGKDSIRGAVTTFTGSPVVSQTYDIQNGVTGVDHLWENGTPLTSTYIMSMSIDMDSALRQQKALQNLGMVGAGIGTFVVSGSIEVYFADGTLYDKFLNDTYTSLIVSSADAANYGYVLSFPKVMLTKAKIEAGSRDTDIMASFEWVAYADVANATAALRKTMFMDRLGPAVTP